MPTPARQAERGRGGVVATAHHLATDAGVAVLADGGNAMDAAVAAAAVLGVVQPMMSGLGGDSFILYRDARSDETFSIQGAGPAPAALAQVAERGAGVLPERGILSAAVPGGVDAMCTALSRFGSGRFSLARLLAPAIGYAADGAELSHWVSRFFKSNEALLRSSATAAAELLIDGNAPAEGERLRQPALARTLHELARHGAEGFYRGEFASALVQFSQMTGGAFDTADLAAYRAEVVRPIETRFGRFTVLSNPPVAQGIVLLEALGILDRLSASGPDEDDVSRAHRMIESLKLAFADRNAHLGDPRFVPDSVARLLADSHLSRRAASISDRRAAVLCPDPRFGDGDTTCLATADRQGNLVAFITSLSTPFGAALIVPGTGVLLNNRAGRGFSPDPASPNRLQAGKRTMSTLHVYAVLEGIRPVMAGGTSGGDGQPQWNLQILDAVLNRGLSIQQAVDQPRWELFPGSDPAHTAKPYELRLDPRLAASLAEPLGALGHRISGTSLGMLGAAQVVALEPDGSMRGAADPRADGSARTLP